MNKTLKGDLEVAAFKGGYGIDQYELAAKEFGAKHPDLKIKVWGNPRVWEQLRPRLVGGDPPDLMFPGWGMDHWALAEENQLMDLDKALDSPSYDGKTKWRDTFEPNLLKLGQKEGKQLMLPYYCMLDGWWYKPDLFAKNGWTPAKTFDELLVLCEKIKAKGIAPITYQGQYPYYMIEGMVLPWTYSIGGAQVIKDAQNLVPGAWKNPAFVKAFEMVATLRDKGYLQEGAVGMSHTESQTEFVLGKAAMIPCGTWLESEMKNVMPPGTKITFTLPPVVAGGKGDPSALIIGIEPWMVPTEAKNPEAAIALYKYMTSLDVAQRFVREKGTLMSIKGANDTKLPNSLVNASKAFKESKDVYSFISKQWYPSLSKECEGALTALLNKQITPQEVCNRVEAAAEKIRKDPGIAKHKLD